MKIPNANAAIIPRRKIEDYLLNAEHPIGGAKAKFFFQLGFSRERWQELASALLVHAQENPVRNELTDDEGTTYIVEGELVAISGRRPRVRSIWLIETGALAPRFITAYPLEV